MGVQSPPFITAGVLGGLDQVFTVSQADGYDNPPYQPNTRVDGTDDSEWVYVKAANAINQYDAVAIDVNGNASQMTTALGADASNRVGFAQVAIPQNSYGWVARHGSNIKGTLLAGSTAKAALYTTATAGVLGTTATSQSLISGVAGLTAPGGANAAVVLVASSPRTLS